MSPDESARARARLAAFVGEDPRRRLFPWRRNSRPDTDSFPGSAWRPRRRESQRVPESDARAARKYSPAADCVWRSQEPVRTFPQEPLIAEWEFRRQHLPQGELRGADSAHREPLVPRRQGLMSQSLLLHSGLQHSSFLIQQSRPNVRVNAESKILKTYVLTISVFSPADSIT